PPAAIVPDPAAARSRARGRAGGASAGTPTATARGGGAPDFPDAIRDSGRRRPLPTGRALVQNPLGERVRLGTGATPAPLARVRAVATALPAHRYHQEALLAAARSQWGDGGRNAARLAQLYRAVGVDGHHLALPVEELLALGSFAEA